MPRHLRLSGARRHPDPGAMPTNSPHVPSLRLAAGLGGFVAAVAAAAVVGIVLATSLITGPAAGHAADQESGRFTVAQDIATSFGWIAVEHAETVKGLTSKDLAGAVHGIGSFVGAERALVKAAVTLRNGPGRPLPYSLTQFTLVATGKDGERRRYPVANASVRDGVLQPDAAVDASLGFVVPRDGATLALEFADPGRERPFVIDLKAGAGRVSAADKRADQHGH
jgi:hypothetical protein